MQTVLSGHTSLSGSEHLTGVRTHPCAGSGDPSLGIPLNPGGHLQTGSTPFGDSQMAFGPHASASEQGLYPGSSDVAELLMLPPTASVSGVTKNGSVVVSSADVAVVVVVEVVVVSSFGVVWNVVCVRVVGLNFLSVVAVVGEGVGLASISSSSSSPS
jgi:hypothetical protein